MQVQSVRAKRRRLPRGAIAFDLGRSVVDVMQLGLQRPQHLLGLAALLFRHFVRRPAQNAAPRQPALEGLPLGRVPENGDILPELLPLGPVGTQANGVGHPRSELLLDQGLGGEGERGLTAGPFPQPNTPQGQAMFRHIPKSLCWAWDAPLPNLCRCVGQAMQT